MKRDNIVLIGMPGAGKSTLGVLVAKALNYRFLDTDLRIQEYTGQLLYETIRDKGMEEFLKIEENVLLQLDCSRTIIATGGSAVYGKKAMKHLSSLGTIVYLSLPYEEIEQRVNNITTRGIAMQEGKTLRDVYEERVALYEKYADDIICCEGRSIEECVAAVFALGQT